jgi:hypothetical protein
MKSFVSKMKISALLAVLLAGFIGCSVGRDTGRLSLSLTDAATNQYAAVYVTIKEIDIHRADDPAETWTTIPVEKTINLIALANGVREHLAWTDLAPGHYTQVRLIIGEDPYEGTNIVNLPHLYANYVIDMFGQLPDDPSDLYHQLKVPSGMQTGVKLVREFDINENSTTELVLDFDASRSVVVAGRSGMYLLKPTVQVVPTPASIVSGTVTQPNTDTTKPDVALEGALVSAQAYDGNAEDVKDQVVVRTQTLSDSDGAYKFFIGAGSYNLVVSKLDVTPPLGPSVVKLEAAADSTPMLDPVLLVSAEKIGKLEGTASIGGAPDDAIVTISVRREGTSYDPDVWIEVWSINVANGGSYAVELPEGTYWVVSWTPGWPTAGPVKVEVTKSTAATLNIRF